MDREELRDSIAEMVEVQATGCAGVGGYRQYAMSLGFTIVKVYDSTSSAGDWSFLVSKDGIEWHILYQTNNWPYGGFSYSIDGYLVFYGTFDEVYTEIGRMLAV